MQTFTSGTASPGELPVTLTAAGVIITIANTDILVETTADADRGLIAYAEAKRLLTPDDDCPFPTQVCPSAQWLADYADYAYCELLVLHPGPHRAPGYLAGQPDITWPQDADDREESPL